jgi:hypothetical protein
LRSAGYVVQECSSERELVDLCESGSPPDLICVSEGGDAPPFDALLLAKAKSMAPVVLFRSSNRAFSGFEFDREVEQLTSPDQWLSDIHGVLADSRDLRESSTEIQ